MSLPSTLERSLLFKNGRPRLTSEESRERQLACKTKWRDANRDYFRIQCAALNARPESLARRVERLSEKGRPSSPLDRRSDPGAIRGKRRGCLSRPSQPTRKKSLCKERANQPTQQP